MSTEIELPNESRPLSHDEYAFWREALTDVRTIEDYREAAVIPHAVEAALARGGYISECVYSDPDEVGHAALIATHEGDLYLVARWRINRPLPGEDQLRKRVIERIRAETAADYRRFNALALIFAAVACLLSWSLVFVPSAAGVAPTAVMIVLAAGLFAWIRRGPRKGIPFNVNQVAALRYAQGS